MTPEQLIEQRVVAVGCGDFEFIYDSYHPQAPFLQQFSQRQEYLDFAEEQIHGHCHIESCRILRQRLDEERAELILHQLLRIDAGYQETLERAELLLFEGDWRYLGSLRMNRAEYSGPLAGIDFSDFDRIPNKVFI